MRKIADAYSLAPKLPQARERFYTACVQLEKIKAHALIADATMQCFQAPLPPKAALDADVFAKIVGMIDLILEWQVCVFVCVCVCARACVCVCVCTYVQLI